MDQVHCWLGRRFQKHTDFADAKSYGTVILRDSIIGREEIQLLGGIINENFDHDVR
jgi:hypothetical protein